MRLFSTLLILFSFVAASCLENGKQSTNEEKVAKDSALARGIQVAAADLDPETDLYAFNLDDGWNLMVDFDGEEMRFSRQEYPHALVFPTVGGTSPDGIDALSYATETDRAQLRVTIYEDSCRDDVSGQQHPFSVRLAVKTEGMDEFDELMGCARYLGRYRVNGEWILATRNGDLVDTTRARPIGMTMHLDKSRMYGYNGCAPIDGTVEVRGDTLAVGALRTPEVDCADKEMANLFTAGLSGREVPFVIKDGYLVLRIGEEETWTLVRGS